MKRAARIPLAAFLAGLLLFVPMRAARADAASDALKQAITLARSSAWDDAVAALPPTENLSREHLALLWDAASALRVERPGVAAHLYAAMRRLEPEAPRPRIALESLWAQNPTLPTLDPADLPYLPISSETISLPASDLGPGATVTLVEPMPYVGVPPAIAPREGYTFPRLETVYVGQDALLSLAFTVRYMNEVDRPLAEHAGRFLGALSILSGRMLGSTSRVKMPFSVWIWPGGKPGAEQWAGAMLLHRTDLPRSPLEWVREIAHEWGHATLRGVDDFTAPEAWANGDLGERLYLPRMARANWLGAWEPGLDVSGYIRKYVDPLPIAFARTGPLTRLLNDTGTPGYDHFLGAALYIDAAYGTPTLVAALDGMDGDKPLDFFTSFRRFLSGQETWTVQRPPGVVGPAPICFPSPGGYILDGRNVRLKSREIAGPQRFPASWQQVDWDGTLTIHRAPDSSGSPSPVLGLNHQK